MSDDPTTPDEASTPREAEAVREESARAEPRGSRQGRADQPDMTRERARSERRDLDKERGEPLAGGAGRGGPRALRTPSRPVPEWTSRPRILVTNNTKLNQAPGRATPVTFADLYLRQFVIIRAQPARRIRPT